ncbi:twin-arginine translocase TatA/TatE family subunit [Microbacterium sp. DT81.1]|uniref:twin-arginine translocase TatA/TatE family subunit n=1 Tax=Microbacterium sp. DT81.1 TaxID=3393413 RepID=UPI003CE97901
MLGNAFGWPHLLIIFAVVVLLFGAAKLPALAKSVGQSARVFKGEMKALKGDGAASEVAQEPAAVAPPITTAPLAATLEGAPAAVPAGADPRSR